MKVHDLSDEKLAEFIRSIVDWYNTAELKNKEFEAMAEAKYPDQVFCFKLYAQDVLTEGARRFANQRIT